MAKVHAVALLTGLLCAERAYAAFGNAFSTGPTASGNFIRQANATLITPAPPTTPQNLLSLWVGMGTSNGDLIQALTESYNGDVDQGCGELNGDWCSWASLLGSSGQVGGPQAVTPVGAGVTMSYLYNDAAQQYDQYVYINGNLVSTYQSSSGVAQGWGTAEECQPGAGCGTVYQHEWKDIVLVLDQAQPSYSDTFGNGGSEGTLTSTDGGLTWTGSVTINEWVSTNS